MVSSLLTASWVIVATIPFPEGSDVVAHRDLDLITVTRLGAPAAKLYDHKGEYVRTIPGLPVPTNYVVEDFDLALDKAGNLVRQNSMQDWDSVVSNPWGPDSTKHRIEIVSKGQLQSTQVTLGWAQNLVRSWDKTKFYYRRNPTEPLRITDVFSNYTRQLTPRSLTKHRVWTSRLWPIPNNRVVALTDFKETDSRNWDVRIPGVKMLQRENPDPVAQLWVTSYLAIIDMNVGTTVPILGTREKISGVEDPVRWPNEVAVFNQGRSVGFLFDNKLYILQER